MKWYILAVCSLVVLTLLGLTAIDKYDERTCETRTPSGTPSKSLRRSVGRSTCDGFLPW